jgi:GTP pyrophosphokinase
VTTFVAPTTTAPKRNAQLGETAASVAAAQARAVASSFAALLERLSYLDPGDLNRVKAAYRFADEAHLGQFRSSGDPYITHPIAVAALCGEWRLDAQAIMAALLHDAMEDCGVDKAELIERFGAPTAELVDGLTKLDKLQFSSREESQAESFRKMLLAMARDVRVILVKLADRLHNMRTLGDVPRTKWARIAGETMDIYAPIAHRLGLNACYRELQDLAFRHSQPWRYETLRKALTKARGQRRNLVGRIEADVQHALAGQGIDVRITGREKTLFSLYRKMQDKHLSFAQVNDIFGFRIVTSTLTDCYVALGVLHQLYKPLPGRFKDYIAIPKANGYQSLHTTLVGPTSVAIEFQIRTAEMDQVAESGVAAHWVYKAPEAEANVDASAAEAQRTSARWLKSLLDIQHETRDSAEFLEHVKVDLFPDAIYVFTPKSRILSLPRGATVVDFAYAIHSDVGSRAVAAKVNGEQVPLKRTLQSGDVVEVITAPVSSPNPDWLNFVRTGRARSRIRHHLKSMAQQESQALGEKLLAQAMRAEGMRDLPAATGEGKSLWDKLARWTGNRNRAELLMDLGLGKRIPSLVARRLAQLLAETGVRPDAVLLSISRFSADSEHASHGVVALDGSEGASVSYAPCCRPVPGDAIHAYLGRGEGLVVHRQVCPVGAKLLRKDSEHFIEVEWSEEPSRPFECAISVVVTNQKGALAEVAQAFAQSEADIVNIEMGKEREHHTVANRFIASVRDATHLSELLRNLIRRPVVVSAERVESRA